MQIYITKNTYIASESYHMTSAEPKETAVIGKKHLCLWEFLKVTDDGCLLVSWIVAEND